MIPRDAEAELIELSRWQREKFPELVAIAAEQRSQRDKR